MLQAVAELARSFDLKLDIYNRLALAGYRRPEASATSDEADAGKEALIPTSAELSRCTTMSILLEDMAASYAMAQPLK